ncbi:MAG: phage tail protein [Caldilineaceae bacterium]
MELFPAHWEMPGWIKCDGQLLNNRQYHLLAYSLATRFGGNGSTTFAVPQLPPVQFTIDGMEIKLAYHIAYEGMYSFTKEPTLSQVALYAAEPDDQWLKCDGRLLSTEEDYALFSLLDTRFGGDGDTTFGIPNLPPLQTPSGAEVPYYICVRGLYPNLQ